MKLSKAVNFILIYSTYIHINACASSRSTDHTVILVSKRRETLYNYAKIGFQTSPTTQGEAHLQIGPKTRGNYLNRHINYCSNFSRRECESVCVKRPVNTGEIGVFAWVSHRELKMVPSFSFLHPFLTLYNAYTRCSIDMFKILLISFDTSFIWY